MIDSRPAACSLVSYGLLYWDGLPLRVVLRRISVCRYEQSCRDSVQLCGEIPLEGCLGVESWIIRSVRTLYAVVASHALRDLSRIVCKIRSFSRARICICAAGHCLLWASSQRFMGSGSCQYLVLHPSARSIGEYAWYQVENCCSGLVTDLICSARRVDERCWPVKLC